MGWEGGYPGGLSKIPERRESRENAVGSILAKTSSEECDWLEGRAT